MIKLLYASTASKLLKLEEIKLIVDTAKLNNAKHGETGFLCTDGKYFLQIIEGERHEVEALIENLKGDFRHREIKIICFEDIDKPMYPEWRMGAVLNIHKHDKLLRDITGSSDFQPYLWSQKECENLLRELAEHKGIHFS